tara:strand:- start:1058 stop:2056 length:999 start_codon:yes stop_codon:yes gene_type:complete
MNHEACSLHTTNLDSPYICPSCCISEKLHGLGLTSKASQLPQTDIAKAMQKRFLKMTGDYSVIIHEVSAFETSFSTGTAVPPDYPNELTYTSRTFMFFQKLPSGMDSTIFCMYVQEYPANQNKGVNDNIVYISYLDSVRVYQPRNQRTACYQECIMSYLYCARLRGFSGGSLWACPPDSKTPNYIFNGVKHRLMETKTLSDWYVALFEKATVQDWLTYNTMFNSYFTDELDTKINFSDIPFCDGDYMTSCLSTLKYNNIVVDNKTLFDPLVLQIRRTSDIENRTSFRFHFNPLTIAEQPLYITRIAPENKVFANRGWFLQYQCLLGLSVSFY